MALNAIVTTTINPPTEALRRFAELANWQLYIVGDLQTPHEEYRRMRGARYIAPDEQASRYRGLSDVIGWNCIQRRNIGFLEAHRDGAEVIATVDDDNIPLEKWGEDLLIGKQLDMPCYENAHGVFEPLSVTNLSDMWHRGYPIDLVPHRKCLAREVANVKVSVQADLWHGHPDVDAMCRLEHGNPYCHVTGEFPFTCRGLGIFNSQNTFLHRSMFPAYCVMPGADRMDDIWGGLILQHSLRTELPFLAYSKPSVTQERNEHDLVNDLAREIPGYSHTKNVALHGINGLPPAVRAAYEVYLRAYG